MTMCMDDHEPRHLASQPCTADNVASVAAWSNTFTACAKDMPEDSLHRRAFERAASIGDTVYSFRLAVHDVVRRLDAGELDVAGAAAALRHRVLEIPE